MAFSAPIPHTAPCGPIAANSFDVEIARDLDKSCEVLDLMLNVLGDLKSPGRSFNRADYYFPGNGMFKWHAEFLTPNDFRVDGSKCWVPSGLPTITQFGAMTYTLHRLQLYSSKTHTTAHNLWLLTMSEGKSSKSSAVWYDEDEEENLIESDSDDEGFFDPPPLPRNSIDLPLLPRDSLDLSALFEEVPTTLPAPATPPQQSAPMEFTWNTNPQKEHGGMLLNWQSLPPTSLNSTQTQKPAHPPQSPKSMQFDWSPNTRINWNSTLIETPPHTSQSPKPIDFDWSPSPSSRYRGTSTPLSELIPSIQQAVEQAVDRQSFLNRKNQWKRALDQLQYQITKDHVTIAQQFTNSAGDLKKNFFLMSMSKIVAWSFKNEEENWYFHQAKKAQDFGTVQITRYNSRKGKQLSENPIPKASLFIYSIQADPSHVVYAIWCDSFNPPHRQAAVGEKRSRPSDIAEPPTEKQTQRS